MAECKSNFDAENGKTIDSALEQMIDKVLLAFKAEASESVVNEVIEKEEKILKAD